MQKEALISTQPVFVENGTPTVADRLSARLALASPAYGLEPDAECPIADLFSAHLFERHADESATDVPATEVDAPLDDSPLDLGEIEELDGLYADDFDSDGGHELSLLGSIGGDLPPFVPIGDDDSTDEISEPYAESRLSRETRAEQVARDFAREHHLDSGMEDLVIEALLASGSQGGGWGSIKRALARRLADDMTEGELSLAIRLRELWANEGSFWNSSFTWTCPSLGWEAAVGIGRSFGAYPEFEEVEIWMYETYERWMTSPRTRDDYHSFHDYVLAITRSAFNNRSICPGMPLSFLEDDEERSADPINSLLARRNHVDRWHWGYY